MSDDQWKAHLLRVGESCPMPSLWHLALASTLEARVIIKIGKAHASEYVPSGYWTGPDIERQCHHAITIFEATHHIEVKGIRRYSIGVWLFDNSTNHSAMSTNALIAQRMSVSPGGKIGTKTKNQQFYLMRPTSFTDMAGESQTQSLVFKSGEILLHDCTVDLGTTSKAFKKGLSYEELIGQPKGMKQVLLERGLPQFARLKGCCKKSLAKCVQCLNSRSCSSRT